MAPVETIKLLQELDFQRTSLANAKRKVTPRNAKGVNITVPLTSYLTGLN
jgi:hypothetical protein